jgi:hypothetical protein
VTVAQDRIETSAGRLTGFKERNSLWFASKPSRSSGRANDAERFMRPEGNLHKSESTWQFDLVLGRCSLHRTSRCVTGRRQTWATKDLALSEISRKPVKMAKATCMDGLQKTPLSPESRDLVVISLAFTGCGSRCWAERLAG